MSGLTPLQQLKLRLLADGIRVSVAAERTWRERFSGPLTLAEYATTSGISLVLPGQLYVNAPLALDDSPTPVLRVFDDAFLVEHNGEEVAVGVIPVPTFHDRTYEREDGTALPITRLGVTHTDRVRVSPIEGCALDCGFCDLPFEFPKYVRKEREQLLDVIRLAIEDPQVPARHVLISGGTPGPVHEAWIDGVYERIAHHAGVPVDVMMTPRDDLSYPKKLAAMGVNAASINIEVSDPERARKIMPRKAERFSREYALGYIERAVEAFPPGSVQSLLVFGSAIEPLEATLRGVQDLIDRGCVPVLSAFRPHHLTPLAGAPAATYSEMVEAYERTLELCVRAGNGVLPGPRCVPCMHNTVTLPLEDPFYVGLDGDLTAPCATC